jgi:hypothetical protein
VTRRNSRSASADPDGLARGQNAITPPLAPLIRVVRVLIGMPDCQASGE